MINLCISTERLKNIKINCASRKVKESVLNSDVKQTSMKTKRCSSSLRRSPMKSTKRWLRKFNLKTLLKARIKWLIHLIDRSTSSEKIWSQKTSNKKPCFVENKKKKDRENWWTKMKISSYSRMLNTLKSKSLSSNHHLELNSKNGEVMLSLQIENSAIVKKSFVTLRPNSRKWNQS